MRSASILKVARAAKPAALGLVIGISISRFAFFMVAPFLAVILNQQFGMPITQIGLLFTVSGLLGLAAGPLGGILADRFGLFSLITISSTIVALGYLGMMLFPYQTVFVVTILVSSFTSGILEPLLRSVLGDSASSDADRAGLHHLRYFGVNVAGAIGPLIGVWFITQENRIVFGIASLGMAILGYTAIRALRAIPAQNHIGESRSSMRLALGHMLANKMFVALFLSNFLLVFIYAQTEEPLTFLMLDMGIEDIPRIIAIMNMINAVTVLLVHGSIMHWIVRLSEVRALKLAAISFALALVMIAANQGGNEYIWFVAIFVSTFGELIAMPLFLTIIDKVAPARHRNTYFGIYILSNLGGVMVPFLAGAMLTLVGATAIFVFAALLCLPLGLVGAQVLANASKPQTSGEPKL